MKIHCFGDSWTQGIGVEWEPGRGAIPMNERYDLNWDTEKELYSWPGQLSQKLGGKYKVNNFGVAGYSNFEIYKDIFDNLKEKRITKGDLVIVCFSSIIREPLNFLTTGNGDVYGFINYSNAVHVAPMQEYPNWIVQLEDDDIKAAAIDMYMNFLVNRLNYESLYEISMNYICNLQVLFESLGIDYLFVNAFENVISDKISFYEQIKKENWILPNYTLSEYLSDRTDEIDESLPYSLWEDDYKNVERCSDGPHPNRIGYGFISELIHSEIVKRKLLKDASVI
jgi:lysophospholipase L1-like esterase